MRCAECFALRSSVCQAVEAMQHEVTCRLPKSHDASSISPCDGSVMCAASILRGDSVGMAAHVIGAVVNVQLRWTVVSQNLNALRAQGSRCGVRDLSLVRMTAPKSGAGGLSTVSASVSISTVPAHVHKLFEFLLML